MFLNRLSPAILSSLCLVVIASTSAAQATQPQYLGSWAPVGSDCTDPLNITPAAIYDGVDLFCRFSKEGVVTHETRAGHVYSVATKCGEEAPQDVRFKFTVQGDILTFRAGIDFGDGFPSRWHSCPSD